MEGGPSIVGERTHTAAMGVKWREKFARLNNINAGAANYRRVTELR